MKPMNKKSHAGFFLFAAAGFLLFVSFLFLCARQVFAEQEENADAPTAEPTQDVAAPVTPEDTPTPEPTDTPTDTATPTIEVSPTDAPSPTPVPTPTPEATPEPTPPEVSLTPSVSPTPSCTATPTPTPYATVIPPDEETHYNVPETDKSASVSEILRIDVDASVEEAWNWYSQIPIENVSWGENGATGSFQVIWTDDALYVLVRVVDATYDVSSELFSRKDCVEVFLNGAGNLPSGYGVGDQRDLVSGAGEVKYGSGANEESFLAAAAETEDGYIVEMKIPFQIIRPSKETTIGFDVRINDSHGQGNRDYMIQWSDTSMYTHVDLSKIGTILLKE